MSPAFTPKIHDDHKKYQLADQDEPRNKHSFQNVG